MTTRMVPFHQRQLRLFTLMDRIDAHTVAKINATDLVAANAVAGAYATMTTGTLVAKNQLTWTAKNTGDGGNGISVTLRDPSAANQGISVTTALSAITVNLATDADSAISSTAGNVITAILASPEASSLLTVVNTSTSDGTGKVLAVTKTNLAGGVDANTITSAQFSALVTKYNALKVKANALKAAFNAVISALAAE